MDGRGYHGLPNVPHYYDPNTGLPIVPQLVPQDAYVPRLQQMPTLSTEQMHQSYMGYEENPATMITPQPNSRARRRPLGGTDHVKHRRTRSGCYTCRNRRVKCDETHPICERCRKGNRDCIYPDSTAQSKSSSSSSSSKHKASTQNEGGSSGDEETHRGLAPIPDDDELGPNDSLSNPATVQSRREASDTPSLTHDKSPSPSTESSASLPQPRIPLSRPSGKQIAARRPVTSRTWAELPSDLRFYIEWHKNNLTCGHYGFKHDGADFLRTTFLEIAIRNEPLLYAVVGFSAYHHTLAQPDGKIQDFLKYYNKSVSLLRLSLQRNQRHTVATLLTILQLASFEEFLGDWVNLIGHQKAAYEILTELYTPKTIMQNETLRKIIHWYIRFDLFAALQAGYQTVLSRDWFEGCHEWYSNMRRERPNEIQWAYEERLALTRLLATDMALIFSNKSKGLISDEDFVAELGRMTQQLNLWQANVDPKIMDPSKRVIDFTGAKPLHPDEIVDPFEPNFLYGQELFSTNNALIDFWSIDLMFKYQLALAQRKPPGEEIVKVAYKMCQMFTAIEYYPHSPSGALLGAQASLAIATMFLPKDEKHIMWARRKLAKIESLGYIYPATLRTRMTEVWQVDVKHWWLPNDENYPPLIRAMRTFIEERTISPRDRTGEDLRDMKGLFSAMSLDDSPAASPGGGSTKGKEREELESVGTGADEEVKMEGMEGMGVDTAIWEEYGDGGGEMAWKG
ncbi:hypothetical protein M501DRAFT_940621 [Patellaria atrata CBS 101060]|uniref:Zn(2)-C6 fungal-type domain-containing protein n=1 Tax=Patellaria atrata CBS 101060 TaxID=1346257 RepID=A0A9P4S6B9_9PEZI|nr:hypothetical protein M501DRAFT_940621 [Patellaria atrata CBS 101060]